jgi:hypothetical protein
MLLTHGCDLDNDTRNRSVALIRPLGAVAPEHQEIIRQNRNLSYFYLPQSNEFPESYVDFRRVTSLPPPIVDQSKRIVGLTTTAVQAMQLQFFRSLTRLEPRMEELTSLAE